MVNTLSRVNKSEYFKGAGRRCALLIGCLYRGTNAELNGCINDVAKLKELLMKTYGWSEKDIITMTDDHKGTHKPTKANILSAAAKLIKDARKGDCFFFSFSGHGSQMPDPEGLEQDGMNEAIVPLDFDNAGFIADNELNKVLVKPLPSGCRLTVILDACHSGTGLDLPYRMTDSGWKVEMNPLFTRGDVQMISGSRDAGTSADALFGSKYSGALTTFITELLKSGQNQMYKDFLEDLRASLQVCEFKQKPVFSSSQIFDFNRQFSLEDIMPNKNMHEGRVVFRMFKGKTTVDRENFLEVMGA
eukprot:GEMP01060501.1.p1 GENE.GEMP01060501.1~~GEMP01060501.1.p1  ORF type:complete len:312 (-),score=41.59 GEMP01060501.1:487-1395(-)